MNYYRRYPGDYARDTAHLTLSEHGAYTVMLDFAYSSEKPLPKAKESVYRLCKAMNRDERADVDAVLSQFWTETDDGWVNSRVMAELEKASPAISAAKLNGKRGGRPRGR